MEQLARIARMEQILDQAAEAVNRLDQALEDYCAIADRLKTLEEYYFGPQWRRDYEDDCAGKLPCGFKRGVLSEDAVYNLVAQRDQLMERLGELAAGERKKP